MPDGGAWRHERLRLGVAALACVMYCLIRRAQLHNSCFGYCVTENCLLYDISIWVVPICDVKCHVKSKNVLDQGSLLI